jgi:hypothetical protein
MQAQLPGPFPPPLAACYKWRKNAVLDVSRRDVAELGISRGECSGWITALRCQSMKRRPGTGAPGSEPQPGGILSSLRDLIVLLAAGGLTWAEKGDGRD